VHLTRVYQFTSGLGISGREVNLKGEDARFPPLGFDVGVQEVGVGLPRGVFQARQVLLSVHLYDGSEERLDLGPIGADVDANHSRLERLPHIALGRILDAIEDKGLLVTLALYVLTEAYLPDKASARSRQLGNATLLISCLGRFHPVLFRSVPWGIVPAWRNCAPKWPTLLLLFITH